ncbi:MAG: hypothetical protein Hyperionvirus32_18 [Hyperionvirus sp.]|uniref:Leucine-rich repeat protein n=1 Tax=Hyperionvirus sp. TaxID=2487770 RepID=A0A3G5AEF4_9VIRU|nr:MAG: hypothetical protein Hyperionvirus32_18 [Hyperionvirus sp.]
MHNIDETNIKKFTHLNDLTLSYCCCPSYAFLNRFTQLTYLKIGCHSESTFLKDDDIINLTNLRNLEISIKGEITDKSIGQLTNLTSLELDVFDSNPGGGGGMPMYRLCEYNKKRLTGLGLGKLTNLIELNVRSPIDGTAIAALTNLEELEIWNRLSDVGAPHMRNLKKLKTFKWKKLDDTGDMLRTLPALRDLSIVLDLKIAKFINNLTNLTSLILHRSGDEKYIPPTRETLSKAFQNLQHLKKLEIGYMLPIIDKDLLPLKNLEILVIPNNEHITGECFSHLPLRKLNLHKNNFINDSRLAECTNLEILNIGGSINRDLEHKRNITKMSLIRLANLRKLNVCLNRTIKLEDLVSLKHLQWIHIHVKEDQTHLLQRFKDSGCKIVHCECWDMRDLD